MTTPTGVHPVADLFPMLADDELAELAEDIKQRGLLHPIVLDTEGRVLDGRNRLAACEMVDVEPTFVTFGGDDPDGYALAVNLQRRNLTKGQQAMIAAKARGVLEQNTVRGAATSEGISPSRLAFAATVLQHAPDLADAVIAGATGLDEAYRVARQRKTDADSLENQLARLRAEDPELAARVVEGELSLKAAWVECEQRAVQRRKDIEDARKAAKNLVDEFSAAVSVIIIGCRFGAQDLISAEMIAELRGHLDRLDGEL